MISVVIYYIASASAVFFYGIGLGRTRNEKVFVAYGVGDDHRFFA